MNFIKAALPNKQVLVIFVIAVVCLGIVTWHARLNVFLFELYFVSFSTVVYVIGILQGGYKAKVVVQMIRSGQIDKARLLKLNIITFSTTIGLSIAGGFGAALMQNSVAAYIGFGVAAVYIIERVVSEYSAIFNTVLPIIYSIKWLRDRSKKKSAANTSPQKPGEKAATIKQAGATTLTSTAGEEQEASQALERETERQLL